MTGVDVVFILIGLGTAATAVPDRSSATRRFMFGLSFITAQYITRPPGQQGTGDGPFGVDTASRGLLGFDVSAMDSSHEGVNVT